MKEAESSSNDVDKSVYILKKSELLNGPVYDSVDQPEEFERKKHQDGEDDCERCTNNSDSRRQADRACGHSQDKNNRRALDSETSEDLITVRRHEYAISENNERHKSHEDIAVEVDNNLSSEPHDVTSDCDAPHLQEDLGRHPQVAEHGVHVGDKCLPPAVEFNDVCEQMSDSDPEGEREGEAENEKTHRGPANTQQTSNHEKDSVGDDTCLRDSSHSDLNENPPLSVYDATCSSQPDVGPKTASPESADHHESLTNIELVNLSSKPLSDCDLPHLHLHESLGADPQVCEQVVHDSDKCLPSAIEFHSVSEQISDTESDEVEIVKTCQSPANAQHEQTSDCEEDGVGDNKHDSCHSGLNVSPHLSRSDASSPPDVGPKFTSPESATNHESLTNIELEVTIKSSKPFSDSEVPHLQESLRNRPPSRCDASSPPNLSPKSCSPESLAHHHNHTDIELEVVADLPSERCDAPHLHEDAQVNEEYTHTATALQTVVERELDSESESEVEMENTCLCPITLREACNHEKDGVADGIQDSSHSGLNENSHSAAEFQAVDELSDCESESGGEMVSEDLVKMRQCPEQISDHEKDRVGKNPSHSSLNDNSYPSLATRCSSPKSTTDSTTSPDGNPELVPLREISQNVAQDRPKKGKKHSTPSHNTTDNSSDTSQTKKESGKKEQRQDSPSWRQDKQPQSTTQRMMSLGGSDEDNNENDDERRRPGINCIRRKYVEPNWILLLLIVLLVVCFCLNHIHLDKDAPLPISTPLEYTCGGQHQYCSYYELPMPESLIQDEENAVAVCRGGVMSKSANKPETEGECTASSDTFPGGNSGGPAVSEEESIQTREEMACIKHPGRRPNSTSKPREQPETPPDLPPRPYSPVEQFQPTLDTAPRSFNHPPPEPLDPAQPKGDDGGQGMEETSYSRNGDQNGMMIMMICHSQCAAFKSPRDVAAGACAFLTDVTIHRVQQATLLHCLPAPVQEDKDQLEVSCDNCSSVPVEEDEDGSERSCDESDDVAVQEREYKLDGSDSESDDSSSIFRGPGKVQQTSKTADRTLDSGMGTGPATNQTPLTEAVKAVVAPVDISWRDSLNNGELVYISPSIDDLQVSFPFAWTSIEEQTPRSPNHQDELVGVKKFDQIKQHQPLPVSEPQLELPGESSEQNLLASVVKVFSYPSPEMNCTHDMHDTNIFIGGSRILYVSRSSLALVTRSDRFLTDTTIAQRQKYPLQYFTYKPGLKPPP